MKTREDNVAAVGTVEDVFTFIAGEAARADRNPFDAEDAWWPEAIRMGLDETPDYIDETGLGVWFRGDLAIMVAPCQFSESGFRWLNNLPERKEWLQEAISNLTITT